MSLEAFQRERIFAPLDMVDTGFRALPGAAARLATCYRRDGDRLVVHNPASGTSFAEAPPFEAGGGGHVSTVDDFLAFGRMLLRGGEYRGRRILSSASVEEMLTDQITPEQKATSPFVPGFWDAHGWGLGVALVKSSAATAQGSRGRFGWWGGFGTTFFADPGLDTVALLFTQRIMGGADDAALGTEVVRHAFGDRA
jgi:CubicO group peptidase (beta-lactamase class C family)